MPDSTPSGSMYRSNARMERVGQHWQATNASISADVNIGADSSIWFGVTIRGDVAPITIGARVNIQENSVLHCDTGKPLVIGDDVTIGHGAIVHCAKVGSNSLIGMAAVILGEAVIGENCIVAAGAVVSPGTIVPDGHVVMGVPAKVVRPVRENEVAEMQHNKDHYIALAREHAEHPERMYR